MPVFLSDGQLQNQRFTKGELADTAWPEAHFTHDCALPQSWVDECYQRGFDDVTQHFVTVYPKDGSRPFIGPVTQRGIIIAAKLAGCIGV